MDCPKLYPSPLPPACLAHCPIRAGQPVGDNLYSVTGAAQNESSPLYGATVQSVNQQVFNGAILTVSITDNPDDKGRGKRKIPECALLAYKLHIFAKRERTRLAREQAARLAEARGKVERIEPGNVSDALGAVSLIQTGKPLRTAAQIKRLLRADIARQVRAKRRGRMGRPTSYAAIGRQVESPRSLGGVSRQYVEQIARAEGLLHGKVKKRIGKQGRVNR